MTWGELVAVLLWAVIMVSAALLFVLGPIVLPFTAAGVLVFIAFDSWEFKTHRSPSRR